MCEPQFAARGLGGGDHFGQRLTVGCAIAKRRRQSRFSRDQSFADMDRFSSHLLMDTLDPCNLILGQGKLGREFEEVGGARHPIQFRGKSEAPSSASAKFGDIVIRKPGNLLILKTGVWRVVRPALVLLRRSERGDAEAEN